MCPIDTVPATNSLAELNVMLLRCKAAGDLENCLCAGVTNEGGTLYPMTVSGSGDKICEGVDLP